MIVGVIASASAIAFVTVCYMLAPKLESWWVRMEWKLAGRKTRGRVKK